LPEIIRIAEALHYAERMRRAGVPIKRRAKILRRWNGFAYALRVEMRRLVRDMQREA